MLNVFIDPKMFSATNDDEMNDRITFFRDVNELAQSGKISVCLYGDFFRNLTNYNTSLFPIDINKTKNKRLKETSLNLNRLFQQTISNHFVKIDINSCEGSQAFKVDKEKLKEDDEYFELFCMLLTKCYLPRDLSDCVLVGHKSKGLSPDENINISCGCSKKEFDQEYKWFLPQQVMGARLLALNFLRDKAKNEELYVDSPKIKKGKHHNKVQTTNFNCYEELVKENRRVLSILRSLGLFEVVFGEFRPQTNGEIGSIKIIKDEKSEKSDIIIGWFLSVLRFRVEVRLHFPLGVGDAISQYMNSEITEMKAKQLLTDLGKSS